ncbi:alpha/beta fold hydrolase [Streptomyces sp. NPDC005262]|uniref:alpha/beta fold hydrolase n=1 Tax=Streptomyces sp. NPDC005262 TaxID=3364710 RepID=UPI0036B3EA3F
MTMSPMEPPSQQGPLSEPASHRARRGLSRRVFVGGAAASAAAAAGVSLVGASALPAVAAPVRRPRGFGSVSTAPGLPAGFARTFTSQFIHAGGLRQHAVIGGDGPPLLLLIHGWPQNWYAWRLLMPELARKYTVIAVDQRGIGLTDKPHHGYDTRTLANDLIALMDTLGHQQFAVAGHDTGMPIGYALAADHPDRIERLAVAEAIVPGVTPSPVLFGSATANDMLWHFPFNRVDDVNEQLVRGREDIYFGWQFATKAARKLPDDAVGYYVDTLATHRDALRGSFGWYRAFDATFAQNTERAKTRLPMPVLAIGGAASVGEGVANTMKLTAGNVQSLVIPACGHWVAEEAPEEMLVALTAFLAPYRAAAASRSLR